MDKTSFTTRILSFLSTALLLITVGCNGRSPVQEVLSEAENLMDYRPDFALALLDSIPPSQLLSDEETARYALLITQAKDKNHLELNTDSLISLASRYFLKRKDKKRAMIATYYEGRVKYLSQDYTSGIVCFLKAREIAKETHDHFWAGMSCRGISDIYNESFNAADELVYAREEYENIKASGRQPYINYALLDLARAYCSNREYAAVLKLTQEICDSAIATQDSHLYYCAKQLDGISYLGKNCHKDAINIFETICHANQATHRDSAYLCLAYVKEGRISDAEPLLNMVSNQNDLVCHFIKYNIFKSLNRANEALQEYEKFDSISNSTFKERISQNLNESIIDHYDDEINGHKIELKIANMRSWLIVIVSILVFLMIISATLYFILRQRKQIEDKVILAEQLQEEIAKNDKNSISVIRRLLSSKYSMLEELCTIVNNTPDSKMSAQKIADSVTKLIESLSIDSKKIVELENEINTHYNNVMTDFKRDLPNLKEADYLLFQYIILGLSNTAISLLLKEKKINAVYDRKRRLKDKIKQLKPVQREKYLKLMA